MGLFTPVRASFDGATNWINTEPLTGTDLDGRVVEITLATAGVWAYSFTFG